MYYVKKQFCLKILLGRGWRAKTSPPDHPASEFEFDVLIGADGKRNTLRGLYNKWYCAFVHFPVFTNYSKLIYITLNLSLLMLSFSNEVFLCILCIYNISVDGFE